MPQHLKIEVDGQLVGQLTTFNKGGTRYDIKLDVPELGFSSPLRLPNVDTGVQRQPQVRAACDKDFLDDFIHARRCIAGVVKSADKFLEELERLHRPRRKNTPEHLEVKPIIMRLMTNQYDRGLIEVHPAKMDLANVVITIGVGACRVCHASPLSPCKLSWQGIEALGTHSHTARALAILRSIGSDLLQRLLQRSPPTGG